MPFAIVPNAAEINMVYAFLAVASSIEVCLYTNDITPDEDSELADFTEATYDGYSRISWPPGTPFTDGAGKASIAPVIANFTGPETGGPVNVYGFYVVYQWSGEQILMAGRLAGAPVTLTDVDDTVALNLYLRMFDAHQ